MVDKDATDLHLKVPSPPVLRIEGALIPQEDLPPLTVKDIESVFEQITIQEQRDAFNREHELDLAYSVPGLARFRVSALRQRGTVSLAFRLVSIKGPSIDELGLPQICKELIFKPNGLILVTGPAGSGKSTTLAAMINYLNENKMRNVITIEDPIEYQIKGISQIQVNPKINLTFAGGLRSIVRQDPDVILVGEIRDKETASIAIQAALTGHLVLSTVHANDAVGALFRLMDLGIEPFLITSAVVGIVAQRLVRRVCPHCRVLREVPEEERVAYEKEMGESRRKFYHGTGCNFCALTGYYGRMGAYEILLMSEEIRRLVLVGASTDEIKAQAIKEGMVTMWRDGMLKVQAGLTTPREVLRNVFVIG